MTTESPAPKPAQKIRSFGSGKGSQVHLPGSASPTTPVDLTPGVATEEVPGTEVAPPVHQPVPPTSIQLPAESEATRTSSTPAPTTEPVASEPPPGPSGGSEGAGQGDEEYPSSFSAKPRRAPKVTPLALATFFNGQGQEPEGPNLQHRLTLSLDPETVERLEGIAGYRKIPEYLRNAVDAALTQKLPPDRVLGAIRTVRTRRDEHGEKKITVHFTEVQMRGLEILARKVRKASSTSVMEGIAFGASMISVTES